MAYELKMSGRIPGDGLEGAFEFLNSFDWNLSILRKEEKWMLFGGDQMIFSCDIQDALESFVLGMALGLAVLPNDFHEKIRELIAE